jgi:hypothetical protein
MKAIFRNNTNSNNSDLIYQLLISKRFNKWDIQEII